MKRTWDGSPKEKQTNVSTKKDIFQSSELEKELSMIKKQFPSNYQQKKSISQRGRPPLHGTQIPFRGNKNQFPLLGKQLINSQTILGSAKPSLTNPEFIKPLQITKKENEKEKNEETTTKNVTTVAKCGRPRTNLIKNSVSVVLNIRWVSTTDCLREYLEGATTHICLENIQKQEEKSFSITKEKISRSHNEEKFYMQTKSGNKLLIVSKKPNTSLMLSCCYCHHIDNKKENLIVTSYSMEEYTKIVPEIQKSYQNKSN